MKLSEQIIVNSLRLRNRIVMPPMATGKAVDGAPDEDLVAYYAARAKATGLIIVEHAYVSPEGMARKTQLSMADDSVIPAYRKLTDAVHGLGAAIFAQISHAGAMAQDSFLPAISPSGVCVRNIENHSAPMSAEDIGRVKDAFIEAGLRAKQAGFDGVEVHQAHGYMLNQFYSPLTNKRTDLYAGGSMDGRTRLQCEIISALRRECGADYPLAIRFGAYDYMEGGSRKEEIPEACRRFAEAGVDLIDISGGLNGYMVPGNDKPGYFCELSRLAKSGVSIPVLVTGGVKTAEDAELILSREDADLVGIGRMMLQDPAWAEHALEIE